MKLQPLATYRAPDYPTQEILRQETDYLREVPRRWRGKRAVLSALAGALALMNQSCADPYRANWGRTMGKVAVPRSAISEDEAKAASEQSRKVQSTPEFVPTAGVTSTPRSLVPEDQAKAVQEQTAKSQSVQY